MQRRLSLFTVMMMCGLLAVGAMGCGSSGSANVSAAEDALENENYTQALQSINAELEANPQNASAYTLKGNILYQQAQSTSDPARRNEMLAEMRAAYDQAIEIDPGQEGQVQLQTMQAYGQEFSRGAQAYNRADSLSDPDVFREAASYFEAAGQIQPDSARTFVLASNAYINAGDYESAVEPLERAVEMGEPEPSVYVTLGQLYLQQQQNEDAIRVLEEATGAYPENADLRSQLLNAYQRAGQTDRAMQAYEDAIANEPQNETYRVSYGTMLLQDQQYDAAIEQFEQAIQAGADGVNTQFNLGVAYRNKAVAINDRIREISNQANDGDLSSAEMEEAQTEIEDLEEQRTELFRQSVTPLEAAREAYQQDPSSTNLSEQQICRSLFTAYVQTDRQDEAEAVESCADFEEE